MPAHLMGRAIDELASGRMDTLTLQNKFYTREREEGCITISLCVISGAIFGSVLSVHLSFRPLILLLLVGLSKRSGSTPRPKCPIEVPECVNPFSLDALSVSIG